MPAETLNALLARAGENGHRNGTSDEEEVGLRFLDRRERATFAS